MKSRTLRKMLAGLVAWFFCAGIALAADRSRTVRATAKPAEQHRAARKMVEFRSESTDSWLCSHVSVFFCSDLFPTLTPNGSGTPAVSPLAIPDRSRH